MKIYKLFFVCFVFVCLNACIKSSSCIIERDSNGKVKSRTILNEFSPGYKFFEEFNSFGVCIKREETINDTLNGISFLYDTLLNEKRELHYEMGVKHGVMRVSNFNNNLSSEALYINDTIQIVKTFVSIISDTIQKKIIGCGFGINKAKIIDSNGSMILDYQGGIRLKSNCNVDVFNLDNSLIDWASSNWYLETLPDTIPLNKDVSFLVEIHDQERIFSKYIKSDFAIAPASLFYKNDEAIISVFKNEPNTKQINCKIKISDKRVRLLRGIIGCYYYDSSINNTTAIYWDFYKQIVVK